MDDDERIAQLEERNSSLVETLKMARDMLIELRAEVEQKERQQVLKYLHKHKQWRLRAGSSIGFRRRPDTPTW